MHGYQGKNGPDRRTRAVPALVAALDNVTHEVEVLQLLVLEVPASLVGEGGGTKVRIRFGWCSFFSLCFLARTFGNTKSTMFRDCRGCAAPAGR